MHTLVYLYVAILRCFLRLHEVFIFSRRIKSDLPVLVFRQLKLAALGLTPFLAAFFPLVAGELLVRIVINSRVFASPAIKLHRSEQKGRLTNYVQDHAMLIC
jgi:hypothetical protein